MWFVRCVLWATPLAFVCYLISGPYQRALLWTALAALGLPARPEATGSVDLSAANVLGMYAAMCLASRRAPPRRRALALPLGLLMLVALEWTSGLFALRTAMLEASHPDLSPMLLRARDELLEYVRWISVPLIWLVMLGRWEVPAAARKAHGSGAEGMAAAPARPGPRRSPPGPAPPRLRRP